MPGIFSLICSIEFIKFALVIGVAVFCYVKFNGKKKKRNVKKSWFSSLFPAPKKKRIVKQKNGKHESRCREILEQIYGREFPSVRPAFLVNPKTGRRLELDCYNEELKLALEYDGEQHAKYNKFFHPNGPGQFADQVKRDFVKDKIVKQRGISLVRVPHYIRYDDLLRYITNRLKELGRL